jgi:peptidoglycan/LPS O-acetylase OafA/YrhL
MSNSNGTTAATPPRGLEIPSLDGIRAVSVAIVFFAHAGLEKIIPGGFGVTCFFFLSGFLITTLLRREREKSGTTNLNNFYMRRLIRIVPPMGITILVSILLSKAGLFGEYWNWAGVFGNFAFMTNYMGPLGWTGPPGTGVLWSLAVEEHFYLLFPVVFAFGLVKLNPKQQALSLVIFCAVVLVWRIVQVEYLHVLETTGGDPRTYFTTDSRLDSIAFGCILALWNNPVLDRSPDVKPMHWSWAIAGGLAILGSFAYRDEAFRQSWRYSIQGLALIPIFHAAITYHNSPWFSWLNWKLVRWIGLMSYTIYLFHMIAYEIVLALFNTRSIPVKLAFAIPLTLLYAFSMYAFAERPLAKLRKRYN